MLGGVGKVLNEVVDVCVVGVEEDERLEPPVLQRVEVVPLHLLAQPLRLVVRPRPEGKVRVSFSSGHGDSTEKNKMVSKS